MLSTGGFALNGHEARPAPDQPEAWLQRAEVDFPKLDKTAFSVVSLFDESDEKAYWWSKTPHQRLQHTELLRRINYGDKVSQRLQRFFEVAERQKR